MLRDISWADYITALFIALVAWYALIGYQYYYSAISSFMRQKKRSRFDLGEIPEGQTGLLKDPSGTPGAKGIFSESPQEDFEIIEELVERVKDLIGEANEKQMPQEGFYTLLQKILSDYPVLKSSAYRGSVNDFICGECELRGIQGITTDAVDQLWHS